MKLNPFKSVLSGRNRKKMITVHEVPLGKVTVSMGTVEALVKTGLSQITGSRGFEVKATAFPAVRRVSVCISGFGDKTDLTPEILSYLRNTLIDQTGIDPLKISIYVTAKDSRSVR